MKITLLKNGHIYTGDARHPWATQLALVEEHIVALDAAADAWGAAPGARSEDLGGATIIPGLTDAHIHLMWYAHGMQALDLRDCTPDALLAQVRERAASTPPGAWIEGRGWDQNLWPGGAFLTADDLDAVAPEHPVYLVAKSAHAGLCNSAALRAAGLAAPTTPDPPHGQLGRRPDGSPNGLLFEDAMALIAAAIPAPPVAEVAEGLAHAQQHLLATGITGIHDVDGGPAFAAFQLLHREERLHVRVLKYLRLDMLDEMLALGLRTGHGDDWLRFGGLKLFADGALGPRTGAMLAPYEGEPDNYGILTLEPDALREIAERAVAGGLALAIHAIGDRTNRLVLDVLERVRPLDPTLRHRIEHVQLIAPEDQSRLARADLVASMQPIHAIHDMDMAERHWGARARHAYAWRSLQDTGAVLAFGSDAPIEIFDPFLGLYAAVTRRREDGAPGPEGWYSEQRLTLAAALRAYTWGAAYAAGEETQRGLLAPGYLADLIVLDRDIFALPPEEWRETQVRRAMVGGEWRYTI